MYRHLFYHCFEIQSFKTKRSLIVYTLLIDNHDSFTYNIFHLLKRVDVLSKIRVVAVEKIRKQDLLLARRVVLSPGAGLPTESPYLMQAVEWAEKTCPLLGICLGHQAIAIHFGGSLLHLDKPLHGVQSGLQIKGRYPLFEQLEQVKVARYHSWVVDKKSFPLQLQITSLAEDGCIMSFQHKQLPIWGIQFHPESFVTEGGYQMISNFFKL